VFGAFLSQTLDDEKNTTGVPKIVQQTIDYLEANGMDDIFA
jgi:hypothetical protein